MFRVILLTAMLIVVLHSIASAQAASKGNPFSRILSVAEVAPTVIERVLHSPAADKLSVENPVYRPDIHAFKTLKPIFRPGVDRISIQKL